MSTTMLRMEEKVFHVLKSGAANADGPYSKLELEDMLTARKLVEDDFVFFPGLDDWKSIGDVFEFQKGPADLIGDGQNLEAVTEAFKVISEQNISEETIQYIAIQELAAADRLSEILQEMPQSIVLTNQRIAVITPALIGDPEINDFRLSEVAMLSNQANRRDGGHLLKIEMDSGDTVDITSLPEQQLYNLIEASREFLV